MRTETHLSDYEAPKNGRNVRTLCGCWVERDALARSRDDASCAECQAVWTRLSEDDADVLAAVESLRTPLPHPVKHQPFDSLAGYRRKEQ